MQIGTYYYKSKKKSNDTKIIKMIEEIICELPESGYRSVTAKLKEKIKINKKKVQRIMKENLLQCQKKPRKQIFSTDSNHKKKKYPNIIKGMKLTKINQIIVGDVTEFDINGERCFLAHLMDLYNREIIGASISHKNNTELVASALLQATNNRGNLSGCIHHTDTDVRYCSDDYIKILKDNKMEISMVLGNAYENAHSESLNKTLKRQEINLNEYGSIQEAAEKIFIFIDKYNTIRPHSALGYLSPKKFIDKLPTNEVF